MENYAFVYEYAADASKEGGVVSRIPEKVISVRAQVQGIAVYDGGRTRSGSPWKICRTRSRRRRPPRRAPRSVPRATTPYRSQVQGIAVYDGGIVLSTSYGLPDSRIFTYENILDGAPSGTATVSGKEVPLYRLDRTNLKSTLTAPCMSEELFVKEYCRA